MSEKSKDPGTGVKYRRKTKRIINKDGSFNVKKIVPYSYSDGYISLINMGWIKFLSFTLAVILIINIIFASLYMMAGAETIGHTMGGSWIDAFLSCLYFSFQSFTTVGYGAMHPSGHLSSVISSFETVLGWGLFAIITGLLYGRFSRPSARIRFSHKALFVRDDKGNRSLQLRIANQRKNMLVNLNAVVMLKLIDHTEEGFTRNYHQLPLRLNHIHFFPLNWTLVHDIDESSPLYNFNLDDLKMKDVELLVLITGFDDTFSQDVHTRFSYVHEDLIWDAKFRHPFYTDDQGDIIFPMHWLDEYESIEDQRSHVPN
ncbi:ion channel [Roseivirga sp. BDSF3-8]|uniref:ion channel n=1 Tax=Roseivirga sp. BDSF3-8 TaxID=3241598 RepID=UPI0035318694